MCALYALGSTVGQVLVNRSFACARLPDPIQRACVAAVLGDLWDGNPTDRWESVRTATGGWAEQAIAAFFMAAFASDVHPVADVPVRLRGSPEALEARFARFQLPAAAQYLAGAQLVRAAWAGQAPAPELVAAVSQPSDATADPIVRRAARQLRQVARLANGVSAAEPAGPSTLLRRFRLALVTGFVAELRTFNQLAQTPAGPERWCVAVGKRLIVVASKP